MKMVNVRKNNPLLKDGNYSSTKEVVLRVAHTLPNTNLFAHLDKDLNIVYHTAADLLKDMTVLGNGLIAMGLEDKHIAVSMDNSYEYFLVDLTISSGVGVITPVDENADDETFVILLNKCDAHAIICNKFIAAKVARLKKKLPNLHLSICVDEGYGDIQWHTLLEKGAKVKDNYYLNKELDPDKVCKILFTSGTTGSNKGVMLTQRNLAANIYNCLDKINGPKDISLDTSMSVLPMHHATEINTHIMARVAAGRLTYICSSMRNLMRDIKIFKPSIITVVPMIANAFYNNIWLNAKKLSKDQKLRKGIKLSNLLRKFGIDITHKLFKDLYEPFGGKLIEIVCGGAILNPQVVKGLNDLGIHIINGYGITECGPLVSMNANTIKAYASIGQVCDSFEYKIDNPNEESIGELCVKGPSVFQGYYKNKEDTAKVFDKDGFFHTGDLVKEDKQKRLYITGRCKNVIILDNGKNICPEEIEHVVEISQNFLKDIVCYQYNDNGKDIIVVGIWTDNEYNSEDLKQLFIDINKKLPMHKKINYVNISDTEYEKTSTKKIKRNNLEKYHNQKGFYL